MNVSRIQTQREPLLLVLSRGSSTSVNSDKCNQHSSPSNKIILGLDLPPLQSCQHWICSVPIRVPHYTNKPIVGTKPVFTLHKGLYYCLEGMCAVRCLRWHEIIQCSHELLVCGQLGHGKVVNSKGDCRVVYLWALTDAQVCFLFHPSQTSSEYTTIYLVFSD